MRNSTIFLPVPKQFYLQPVVVLAFSLLLLSTITLYYYHILNPFLYILSPLSSSPPLSLTPLSPTPPKANSLSTRTEASNCDISRGGWVPDPNAPYYTDKTCWTIHEQQNCLKYGRPNREYLKWRWKPENCELPLFNPQQFLEIVRGKSMAFVGDSLARNHMQSLMCLLSRVEYPKDISYTTDADNRRMFYENYNFTVSTFWSPFLVRAKVPDGPKDPWSLYLDEIDEAWISQMAEFDYIIISDGNWFPKPAIFYENQEVVGCNNCQLQNITDLTLRYSNRRAFRTAFSAINRFQGFKGMVILRSLSPDHFENGQWETGGDCVRTRPYKKNEVSLDSLVLELYEAQIEEFREAEREGRKRGLEFKLLDTTRAMLLRPDGHPSHFGRWRQENRTRRNDCVHWCLPGPIDVWNQFLLQMMSA